MKECMVCGFVCTFNWNLNFFFQSLETVRLCMTTQVAFSQTGSGFYWISHEVWYSIFVTLNSSFWFWFSVEVTFGCNDGYYQPTPEFGNCRTKQIIIFPFEFYFPAIFWIKKKNTGLFMLSAYLSQCAFCIKLTWINFNYFDWTTCTTGRLYRTRRLSSTGLSCRSQSHTRTPQPRKTGPTALMCYWVGLACHQDVAASAPVCVQRRCRELVGVWQQIKCRGSKEQQGWVTSAHVIFHL